MLPRPPLPLGGLASSSIHPTVSVHLASSARRIVFRYRQASAAASHVSPLYTLVSTCPVVKRRSKALSALPLIPIPMASLTSRRPHTTSPKGKEPERRTDHDHDHDHDHAHESGHEHGHEHHNTDAHLHSHSHSHSVFGSFAHAHTHGEGGHGDAEKVVEALRGAGASKTRG